MPASCQKNLPLWRQIQRKNFTKLPQLLEYLEFSEENQKKIWQRPRFSLNLPQRLASKITKNDLNDPLLRQFVPLEEEQAQIPGFAEDPVQDQKFQKTGKMLHKYYGRALLVTTSACAMHCRYCFRQNFPYETEDRTWDAEIAYIQQDSTLSELILSGGDPLSLSDETLADLFRSLNAISHLRRIRFHTRFPIGIPERITPPFLDLLASSLKKIFFVIHVNHPRELDPDVLAALQKIQLLGIPILNQSVLLKGVNDDEKTLLALSEALIDAAILPYYLHCLDPVQGAAHFALPDERGPQLIRYLQKHLSGFGVPRLVREEPGSPSKTFITH